MRDAILHANTMIALRFYEDLRHALRLISGNRSLSAAVFVSLALGIGASATMLGVVDSFLFRPLPVPQTDKVVRITSVTQSSALEGISYPDFDDLRKPATAFEALTTARIQASALETN